MNDVIESAALEADLLPVELDAMAWRFTTGRHCALGHDFAIRTMDVELGRYLDRLLQPLQRPGVASHRYSFVERDRAARYPYVLYHDGERLVETAAASRVLSVLLWHINRAAVASSPHLLLLHAAGAELGGKAVVLPARMESGKTTLVAGLVRAGMRYLTDEAVAIDPAELTIAPFPKPLSVDRGSWRVLADLRPGPELPARYRRDQWAVDVRSIRVDAVGQPSVPAFVVLPRYTAGAPTTLSAMRRAEALYELTENAFNLPVHGAPGLAALGRLVRQCPCYRLVVGDLGEACDLVLQLFQAGEQPGRASK